MEERLTAYVPYCLGKIKKLPEWRKSPFAKMSWEEVNSAIISSNQELLYLIADIAKTYKYDSTIITRWIGLRASAVTKDFYIARTVQDLKMHKLTRRVWRDQNHMDFIPKDDSDLTTKALCLAFWTFRNDWFRTIQSRSLFLARWRSSGLVNKSCVEEIWKWQIIIFDVPARVRRRNIYQSVSRKNCLNKDPLIIKIQHLWIGALTSILRCPPQYPK